MTGKDAGPLAAETPPPVVVVGGGQNREAVMIR